MLFQNRIGHSKTIERVVALIPRDASDQQNAQAANFIRQYYSLIDEEDLAKRKMPDLCGSALAHLQFMREYKSGSPKLRIYNPQLERDGLRYQIFRSAASSSSAVDKCLWQLANTNL
jgi:NAD-specific glutamate dehydrogenase